MKPSLLEHFKKFRNKRRRLFSFIPLSLKFFCCYALLILTMFGYLNTYGTYSLHKKLLKEKQNELYDICSELSGVLPLNISTDTLSEYTDGLEFTASLTDCRLWIADTKGTLCYDSKSPDNAGTHIPDYDAGFLDHSSLDSTTAGNLIHYKACAVIYPLTSDFKTSGYLIAFYPVSRFQTESICYIDVYNLCFSFYCIFLAVVFTGIYFITVHPLKRCIQEVQSYSSRNYEVSPGVHTADEYEELSAAASFLAGELKHMEDYQKKFVANISHDLRSPLTSIKGYAEAMADGTIPQELQPKYLNIIIYETTRLTKLSQNLLALNNSEDHSSILNITSFDINDIIRKTSLSFEGTGRQKGIRLHLLFEEPSMIVSADMEKIQQVLYNLIDNAIKFSYENKSIRIMTKTKGTKAIISVKDSGIGIPKESLNKVFDRFYKTDISRGRDKKGTGLGLAIVKEIITAHKEHITVVSTEGAGTEFTFSLSLMQKKTG